MHLLDDLDFIETTMSDFSTNVCLIDKNFRYNDVTLKYELIKIDNSTAYIILDHICDIYFSINDLTDKEDIKKIELQIGSEDPKQINLKENISILVTKNSNYRINFTFIENYTIPNNIDLLVDAGYINQHFRKTKLQL